MPIIDLFSKRQKKLKGEMPDVYQYEEIPHKLRVQIVHIIRDTLGRDYPGRGKSASLLYEAIHNSLCREYGLFDLHKNSGTYHEKVFNFLLDEVDYERILDVIELTFACINNDISDGRYIVDTKDRLLEPNEAIAELNGRFNEHGVGYQFESDRLIRIDSQFIHKEIIKPAIYLLQDEDRFRGANEEFLKAHGYYRKGDYSSCLVEANKSFESVLKAICDKQNWNYAQKDTVHKLVEICLNESLIPIEAQSHLTGLRTLLENSVNVLRNKYGGHGQGTVNIKASKTIASYGLYLAATNILFLIQLEKEL